MKKRLVGCLFATGIAGGLLMGGGVASAAQGGGASICSFSGQPDHVVTADPSTWNNPGEAISFFAPQGVNSGLPNPGQQVKAFCNPTLQP